MKKTIQIEKLRWQILSQKPTKEQKEAIFSEESEFLLRASPGSGKTWTSCRRFIWKGANWSYRVGGLALLSFTNAAIKEFYEATSKIGQRELLSDPNYVGTFDSFIERFIISPFGHLVMGLKKRPRLFLAPRSIDHNNRRLHIYIKLKDKKAISIPAWEIIPFPEKKEVAFRAMERFGRKILNFQSYNPVEQLFKLGFYTHEQRGYFALRVLQNRPHICKYLSRRFPEIIVDEAQDTNIWLLKLLHTLHKNGTKVTLIGDPDQCIYEFSMARAELLLKLKEKWNIPEKHLSISFRCINSIAKPVSKICSNTSFCGPEKNENAYHRPFIVKEPNSNDYKNSIEKFIGLLNHACIPLSKSAILCRAHKQLESIRGELYYNKLQGITKEFAQAAFNREVRQNYKKTFQIAENAIRKIIQDCGFWEKIDEDPESKKSIEFRLALWRFIKSPEGLPSLNVNGFDWIENLKINLINLFSRIGIQEIPRIGQKIRHTGISKDKLASPLFEPKSFFPSIRQETIHQVKGESIDGVLVLGSTKFFNSVVKSIESKENSEEQRLAYVGMTRARYTLLIGLPAAHYNIYRNFWIELGFSVF